MIKKDPLNLKTLSLRMEEQVKKTHLVQFEKIELGKSYVYLDIIVKLRQRVRQG